MSEFHYVPNAGQTYLPFSENVHVPTLPFEPLGKPETPYAQPVVRKEYAEQGYILATCAQHFLPGVSAQMLDWFWANMEKCYYLWAPGSHKRFNWVKSPVEYGFTKSAHMISEVMVPNGPVFGGDGVQINRMDLCDFPLEDCLEHAILECVRNDLGEFVDATIHMWEDAPGGANHVVCSVVNTRVSAPPSFVFANPEAAATPEQSAYHSEYEASMWPKFLPQMYELWKNHPDPSQSVPCDLRVRKTEDGGFAYLAENGPIHV